MTLKILDVPILADVAPVNVMLWPFWATVKVILTVAVPAAVLAVAGVAPPSANPKVILTVSAASAPVVILLL